MLKLSFDSKCYGVSNLIFFVLDLVGLIFTNSLICDVVVVISKSSHTILFSLQMKHA